MIIKILNIIFGFPIYWLSKIFPKDSKLEVIGSSLGRYFADNPKYFFINHYNNNNNNIKLIWVTKSKNVVLEIRKNSNLPVVYLYSLKGVYFVLRASKAYISHRLDDINGSLMGGAVIIQLWHGVPLKKIGYKGDWDDKGFIGKVKVILNKLFPYTYYITCDILVSPSEKVKYIYIEAFSQSFRNDKIAENIVLGIQPRTTYFIENIEFEKSFFPEIEFLDNANQKFEKIISWLPTQRKQLNKTIVDVIKDTKLDFEWLDKKFKEKNYLFVIKAHFLDMEALKNSAKNYDNIIIYPHSDPYPLLKFTDILITDYSSVFFDFLLLDRPIIFLCHDLVEYTERVSLYYNLEDIVPGVIYKQWSEIVNNIDKDEFSKERERVLDNFKFVRNTNSRGVIEEKFNQII